MIRRMLLSGLFLALPAGFASAATHNVGPGGELPVISGENAITPSPLNFWNEDRGLLKIGGSNVPAGITYQGNRFGPLAAGAGNSQILHYGGDSGDTSIYRKGTLHFFRNTVVSTRSGNTTLMRLSTDEERADVRNNILYVAANGNRLALVDADGVVDLSHNWAKSGWVGSHSGLSALLNDDGSWVLGTTPGFVDGPVVV